MKVGILLVLLLVATSCSTVAIPVLRHETGETLGTGRVRAYGRYETARVFSSVPSSSSAYGVPQNSDVFQASLLGLMGSVGVHPRIDLQAGTFLSMRGGGWRLGGKYQAIKWGNFSIAGMAGFGACSSSGSLSYLSSDTPVEVAQTLSASTLDFSAPVSYRFGPGFVVYSGVMFLHSTVRGQAGGMEINMSTNDLGANLGFRASVWKLDFDLEAAMLEIYDPFSDSLRFVPFLGIGVGVSF